jgi:hypothetical protein
VNQDCVKEKSSLFTKAAFCLVIFSKYKYKVFLSLITEEWPMFRITKSRVYLTANENIRCDFSCFFTILTSEECSSKTRWVHLIKFLTKLTLLKADFTKFISNVIKSIHICVSCNPAVTGHSVAYKFREIKVNAAYRHSTHASELYWKQNNCELRKRHGKKGKKMERARGKHDGEESVWACIV